MKKISLLLIILSLFFCQLSAIFEIEKVGEFGFAQRIIKSTTQDRYLYSLIDFGFEISYIEDTGELTFVSRYTIPRSRDFIVDNDFIYVLSFCNESDDFQNKILKIDIWDKANPIISDEIKLEDKFAIKIELYNQHLLLQAKGHYTFYNLEDLSEVSSFEQSELVKRIDNSYAFYHANNSNNLNIYDFSEPNNWKIIGNVDLSNYHNSENRIWQIKTINDTIAVCASQRFFSFWDMNSATEWEFISHIEFNSYLFNESFTVENNKLIIPSTANINMWDISDVYNPQLQYSLPHINYFTIVVTGSGYQNNYYLNTYHNGMQRFKIIDNEILYCEDIAENFAPLSSGKYNNYLFVSSYCHGISVYDVSNPMVPEKINTLFENEYISGFRVDDNTLSGYFSSTEENRIYDISDPINPILLNTNNDVDGAPFWDLDNNSLYIWDVFKYKLRKYDISEQGKNIFEFEFDLPDNTIRCNIHNSHVYVLTENGNYFGLQIYKVLETNEAILVNQINNWQQKTSPSLLIRGNYLCFTSQLACYGERGVTRIYSLETPDKPTLLYDLHFAGNPFFFEDLIFTGSGCASYVYETNNPAETALMEIANFADYTNIKSMEFHQVDNSNYLFLIQKANLAVFKFKHTVSASNSEIPSTPCNLSNYPNPFNPTTTIQFNIDPNQEYKQSELGIYNIKGQRIREFKIQKSKFKINKVVWDGKDNNGNLLSSGVYMYQLKLDGKAVASKKMMLMK